MPAISIVLLTHNRREALRLTLESLARQTAPAGTFEGLVVDGGSTDGTQALVRDMQVPYPLRLLEQGEPLGFSAARNAGIGTASGPILLLLDADLVADPGLVAAHLACHAAHPGALACGRVLPYPPAYRTFVERAADPDAALDRGAAEGEMPFYNAFGGHLSFSLETFHAVGPFDPALNGFEDIDWAYRAAQAGRPIVSCPAAVAYHNHPRTLRLRLAQARSYNRMWPQVLQRYPELRGAVPGLRDYEPVDLRRDRGARLSAKLRVRLLAVAPVRAAMGDALRILERTQAQPRIAKGLYWRLLRASWYVGFREGSRT